MRGGLRRASAKSSASACWKRRRRFSSRERRSEGGWDEEEEEEIDEDERDDEELSSLIDPLDSTTVVFCVDAGVRIGLEGADSDAGADGGSSMPSACIMRVNESTGAVCSFFVRRGALYCSRSCCWYVFSSSEM